MTSPTRRRGRPAADSADQRQRLLDAALALFAERGIAATPLNAIARRARVTPALLHYYFGQRDALIDAVVEERLLPLVQPVLAAVRDGNDDRDPRDVLTGLARALLAAIGAAPWLPPLWVREILGEGGALRERLLMRVAPPVMQRVRALVQRGQAAGSIHPDLDPRLVPVSLIGLTLFALAAEPIWRRMPDSADIDHDTLAGHVVAMLQHGLEPPHAP